MDVLFVCLQISLGLEPIKKQMSGGKKTWFRLAVDCMLKVCYDYQNW